jgi:hypothetical protein
MYERVKNSLEAVLAELSVEDVKDEVDDKDFVIAKGQYAILACNLFNTPPQTRKTCSDLTLKAQTRRPRQRSRPLMEEMG